MLVRFLERKRLRILARQKTANLFVDEVWAMRERSESHGLGLSVNVSACVQEDLKAKVRAAIGEPEYDVPCIAFIMRPLGFK